MNVVHKVAKAWMHMSHKIYHPSSPFLSSVGFIVDYNNYGLL